MNRGIAGALAAIMLSAPALAQLCLEGWISQFPDVSFSGGIHGMLERVEDGEPVLYLVGNFAFAGGVRAPQVVRWDGAFTSMGDPPGSEAHRSLVVVDPDGAGPEPERFFIGGGGGSTGSGRVAMWDGAQWLNAADSLPQFGVLRLRVIDDGTGARLFAFGGFNGVFARNTEGGWDQIGELFTDWTSDGVYFDLDGPGPMPETLVVGGEMRWSQGEPVNRVAWLDATTGTWHPVGEGFDGFVTALAVLDEDGPGPMEPALYAAGRFTRSGATFTSSVARWDGAAWQRLGSGVGPGLSTVNAIHEFSDAAGHGLIVGGEFKTAGGKASVNTALWRNGRWEALSGTVPSVVNSLARDPNSPGAILAGGGAHGEAVHLTRLASSAAGWRPLSNGVTGTVNGAYAAVVHPIDGVDTLVIGGEFSAAAGGTVAVNHVAGWDGQRWSSLASGFDHPVQALVSFDDGHDPILVAGGSFGTTAGRPADHIMARVGARWNALLGNANGPVYTGLWADLGAGPRLYVGGGFTTIGGVESRHIAAWDGERWESLDGGIAVSGAFAYPGVHDMVIHDDGRGPALFVVGAFGSAGALRGVARWDGTAWSDVGGGATGSVYAAEVFDDGAGPALYIGGRTDSAGGLAINNIARWDGAAWSDVQGGVGGFAAGSPVYALEVIDHGAGQALLVGGRFVIEHEFDEFFHLATWDGTTWEEFGGGVGEKWDGHVNALLRVIEDGAQAIYVAGSFSEPGRNIARWSQGAWSQLDGGLNREVFTLQSVDSGSGPEVYAGGIFDRAGAIEDTRGLAIWTGDDWRTIGAFAGPGDVRAIIPFQQAGEPSIVVGGAFDTAAIARVNHVASFNGSVWEPMGDGFNGVVYGFAQHDDGAGPALYAMGSFTASGETEVNRIARWDGAAWRPVGDGFDAIARCGISFDDGSGPALYVGGGFTTAGEVNARRLARWRQGEWEKVGGTGYEGGFDDFVMDLEVFDDGGGPRLHAIGDFDRVTNPSGSISVGGLVVWDGADWTEVGGGIGQKSARHGKSLLAFEGPEGPQLFVGGAFAWVDGLPAAAAAIWDGSEWNRMEGGLVGTTHLPLVRSMTAYEDDIGRSVIMTGLFQQSGSVSAQSIARWGCTDGDELCYADCDRSQRLDFFDFLCFQEAYQVGDSYADCDRSGEIDFFDFLCFQNQFAAGCQ